jgi:NitT/TauT family transport system permease protein
MKARRYMENFIFPISVVLLLIVWEVIVRVANIPSYLLAPPSNVAVSLWKGLMVNPTDRSSYLYHLSFTLKGAGLGYVIGGITGIILGSLIAEFRLLERVIMPYAISLQTLPKVAVAPMIMIWFGFGIPSKAVLAALLTFFPLLINTNVGLKMSDPDALKLLRGLQATRWQVFRYVKFPGALPLIFSGLNMSMVYALLGALVAEFVGAQAGIGVMILQSQYMNDTATVFGALVLLAALGITLHKILGLIEKRLVFWGKKDDPMITS